MEGQFIAVDWGTTNRRIFVIGDDGQLDQEERDERGVLAIAPGGFADEVQALRVQFGDLPILCAGMVGSARGWVELPYVPVPGGLDRLAAAAYWVEPQRTAIVTGLSLISDGRADVMRGEEIQFLGAVDAGLVPPDGLLCQPGTHCKWARMEAGKLAGFTTAMTGELFALLKSHSLLGALIEGEAEPNEVFLAGVERASSGEILADLFEIRAASLLRIRQPSENVSYLSGLLIGNDVRARLGTHSGDVFVLTDGSLGQLYGAAIQSLGATPRQVDSRSAFTTGMKRIWEKMT